MPEGNRVELKVFVPRGGGIPKIGKTGVGVRKYGTLDVVGEITQNNILFSGDPTWRAATNKSGGPSMSR